MDENSAKLEWGERDEPMSREEFEQFCKDNPEKADAWRRSIGEVIRRADLGEFGELPPELRAETAALATRERVFETLARVQEHYKAFVEIRERPGGSMQAEEHLSQCKQLAEELVDMSLSLPEPDRTAFLQDFVPWRDGIRKLGMTEE